MSGRITIEMISDETSKACRDSHFEAIRNSEGIGGDPGAELAAILNAAMQDPVIRGAFVREAIKRGEASPPCYTFRYHYNSDIAHSEYGTQLFDSVEHAEKAVSKWVGYRMGDGIHWKGERCEE